MKIVDYVIVRTGDDGEKLYHGEHGGWGPLSDAARRSRKDYSDEDLPAGCSWEEIESSNPLLKDCILDRSLGDHKYFQTYRNILFTESGFARLWATIGYFRSALEHCSDPQRKILARQCLDDLHKHLNRYNNFGGNLEEFPTIPSYKFVLGDDGCFGSFTFAAYSAVTSKVIGERAAEAGRSFDSQLHAMNLNHQFQEDLRHWNGHEGYVYYGRAFNGGLIFHTGAGDDELSGSYGSHT